MTRELEENRTAKAWTPALIALLVPIGIGAIWVAMQGRHGDSNYCTIDVDGGLARYGWDEPMRVFRNQYNTRIQAFDLATGNLVKQHSAEGIIHGVVGQGDDWIVTSPGADRFQLIKLGESATKVDFTFETDKTSSDHLFRFIDDNVLFAEFNKTSVRLSLVEPVSNKIVDRVSLDSKGVNYILPVIDTRQIVNTSYLGIVRTQAAGKTQPLTNCQFFRVHHGKIELLPDFGRELVGWPKTDEFGNIYATWYSNDGKSIEVRSIVDDSLKNSIPFSSGAGFQGTGPSWIVFGNPNPSEYVDLLTSQPMPVPSGYFLMARDQRTKRMLVLKRDEGVVKIIDEVSGTEIANLPIHEPVITATFASEGKELWVATPSCRTHRINAISGEHLQVVDPYRNVAVLEFLSALVFFAWACLWVWNGSKVHRHAWLDCAVITGLCVAYIIARTRLVGFPSDVIRPIYQMAEGIFASWLILTSLWLVLGRTRITLRILPHLAISGIIILLTLISVGFGNSMAWELVIAVGLLSVWLIVVFLPLRLFGYTLRSVELLNAEPSTGALSKAAVPMRDIFLLTTVLAGLVALSRYAPPALAVTLRSVLDLFVLVFSVTLTGIVAVRFGLSQRTFAVRFLSLAVMVVVALCVPVLWQVQYRGWKALKEPDLDFVFWEIRLHASTAIATAICLYTYRLRGWRIGRTR